MIKFTCLSPSRYVSTTSAFLSKNITKYTLCLFHTALHVTIDIQYDPPCDYTYITPPYYQPASSVTLTCNAQHAVGSVSYEWSSTCSNCFVGNITRSISEDILTSSDTGNHTCSVIDEDGNAGSATTQMIMKGSLLFT